MVETPDDRFVKLCHAFMQLKTEDAMRRFLIDLCTPGEIKDLSERWLIARLLHKGGMSYRDISAATGASTTTVGRVARFLEQEPHKGYKTVLEKK
jgi:TrpR-related protein YerC/YecD